ncbi:ATP-binding protein [Sphaerisporangium fuscum]|uniref:ATP-binding protein n=1 Tax=Sphaerisporangium fuscum TaxID=2835868 RepID=UPI001BDCD892|nr:ATP-binding protein [Sphaerisporangium fuscum]
MTPWRMSRSFLSSPPSVTEARRFVTAFLSGWPVVDTAELIVSELATNAIRHSASKRFGGRFYVGIQAHHDRVWLGVSDEGGSGAPAMLSPDEEQEGGRGLLLVATLADSYGVRGDENGRTVWAVMLVDTATASPTPLPGAGASSA